MTPLLFAPSSRYGQFEEQGYWFEAFIPARSQERQEFLLTVRARACDSSVADSPALFELHIPMCYAPRFGVDVGDATLLEQVTDTVVQALGAAGEWSPALLPGLSEKLAPFGVSLITGP